MVLGDSISAGYGIEPQQAWVNLLQKRLDQQYPKQHKVVNASVSGETTSGALARLPKLLQTHKPNVVVIELGGNDGLRGQPPQMIQKNLAQLIQQSQKANATVVVLGMKMPPNYGTAYSKAFENNYKVFSLHQGFNRRTDTVYNRHQVCRRWAIWVHQGVNGGLNRTAMAMTKYHNYRAVITLSRKFNTANLRSHAVENTIIKDKLSLQSYLLQERVTAGLKTKTLKVDDIVWSYNEGGAVDKPTILLIHGFAGNRDNWNRVAQFLTPYYHVVIPDLPTNGDTKVPDDFDLSMPNVTERLRRFVEAIHIQDKLNVAGHSIGGSIATLYAAQYPFDTQSLFLLNSAGIYKNANTNYAKDPQYLKHLIVSKPGDFDDVMQRVMQTPIKMPYYLKRAQEKQLITQAEKNSKVIDQLVTLNRIYTTDSFARVTRNIEAPTLILWGKQDKIINVEVANELKSLLKRAEAPVILNNVGHMPLLEAEQAVAQHYLPFLAKTQKLKNPLADKLIPLN
ncbi:unnamed protein product [Notodromas monacha]|uniref:acylglycerol lipase n=1 Tax=Notodromas monacha TaxID=399045 RepID=A0A7R9C1I5_9CRUS|nr:unnamed protein product [Notodromas monacha]CAG0924766.1 unnamed protein product [Notodromas monacha]